LARVSSFFIPSSSLSRFSLPGTLFFGLPLMTLAAVMAADLLYFHSTREFKRGDLVEVAGVVERTAYIPASEQVGSHRSSAEPYVDIWMKGREYPYRFFGSQWHCLSELPPGAPISVGLNPDVMKSPLKPTFWRPAPSYVPLTVLHQGIWLDSRLSHHNQLARDDLWTMPWLSPLLAVLAVITSTRRCTDFMAAQTRRRYGTQRKPMKGRLSLRLLKPGN
jgi:hypothetical protein